MALVSGPIDDSRLATSPELETTGITYDEWGRPKVVTHPDNTFISIAYDPASLVTMVTDELDRSSTFAYDDAMRLVTATNAKNESHTFAYDVRGLVTSITNARNKTRTYTYTDRGEVHTLTLPDNSVETWSYNANGQVTGVRQPAGLITTNIYFSSGSYANWLDKTLDFEISGTNMIYYRTNSFTYANGLVYVASGFRFVTALDAATGAVRWRTAMASPVHGAPNVVGGRVFVVNVENELFALDAANGDIVWNYQALEEPARILAASTPAVSGDVVVAPFSSGELVALRVQNGTMLWTDTLAFTNRLNALSEVRDIPGRPVIYRGDVFIEGGTMPGSGILDIVQWRQRATAGKPMDGITPLQVADALDAHAAATLKLLDELQPKQGSNKELRQTLGDLEAMSGLGRYYAAKVRGAAERTAEQARQLHQQYAETAEQGLRRAGSFLESNPLATVGIAFVAGVLLSAMIRR